MLPVECFYPDLFYVCIKLGYIPNKKISLFNYRKFLSNIADDGNYFISEYKTIVMNVANILSEPFTIEDFIKSNKDMKYIIPYYFFDIILSILPSFDENDMLALYDNCIYIPIKSPSNRYDFSNKEDKYYKRIVINRTKNIIDLNIDDLFISPNVRFREHFRNKDIIFIKDYMLRYNVKIDKYCINNMILEGNKLLLKELINERFILPKCSKYVESNNCNLLKE